MASRSDDDQMTAWRLFWAKTDYQNKGKPSYQGDEWTYPLWAHLVDVANVACILWELTLTPDLCTILSNGVGLPPDATKKLMSLWIGLHDVGKAIPQFQEQHLPSRHRLKQAGLDFHGSRCSVRHEHASIAILDQWVSSHYSGREYNLLLRLSEFVGIHHGRLCTRSYWEDIRDYTRRNGPLGDAKWRQQQVALVNAVITAWGLPKLNKIKLPEEDYPSWLLAFAGWATFSDWIGSMKTYFPASVPHQLEKESKDFIRAYIPKSRKCAEPAIEQQGLHLRAALRVKDGADGFMRIFQKPSDGFTKPRALQEKLAEMSPPEVGVPTLTIVEAPTAEGKSEGAFFLSALQQRRPTPGGGVYVAMPTQATSNELFKRFRDDFLLPDPEGANEGAHDVTVDGKLLNLHLVHGNAHFHPEMEAMRISTEDFADLSIDSDEPEAEAQARALEWFLSRKRGLLAPYGVGTVDQTFLSVLYAKHFFLRLFGLAGKTIIFDEVHAYDVYMTTLFVQLLKWLRELGCHVILLSATLPEEKRVELIKAWGAADAALPKEQSAYPAIWQVPGYVNQPICFKSYQSKGTQLCWHSHEPKAVVESVVQEVNEGGTVGVICNTVARAQKVFELLLEQTDLQQDDLMLFHARFPFERRQGIEKKVLKRFGRRRPSKAGMLVATQVAEQSLNLDVDVMFSDLAPIDLLLQRNGRLQRYQDRHRRKRFMNRPTLHVLCPPLENSLPKVGKIGGGKIYDTLTLWRTWLVLNERIEKKQGWNLPHDYRPLIEAVYRDMERVPEAVENGSESKQWDKAVEVFSNRRINAVRKAKEEQLIPCPEALKKIFDGKRPELAEEDERVAEDRVRVLTRNGPPSVEVLCLYRHGEKLRLGKTSDAPVLMFDLNQIRHDAAAVPRLRLKDEKNLQHLRSLAGCAVRLQGDQLVKAFEQDPSEEAAAWKDVIKKNGVLRRYQLMIFTQRSNGRWIWSQSGCPCWVEDIDRLGLRIHWPKR